MAVEAARQLTPHDFREFSAVRMTNVDILNSSALKTGIQRADTVETRLICRKNGQSTQIAFEIHCVDDSIADQWVLCAKGKIEFIPHAPPKSLNGRLGAADDPILIQKAQTCYPHVITDTEGLRMSNGMVQGTTTAQSTSWQLYPIHPQSLAWVLSLGPTSLLGSGIPVNYRVVSLDTLHLPVTPSSATAASFDIRTSLTRAGGAKSTISVDCDGYRRLAGEVFYEATDPVPLKPVTSSLFFKPLCLPDITKHMNQHAMSIERCLQLINRKWPMSDIRMRDIPAGAQERLMEILHNRQPWETSKFCTITMHGDAGSDIDDERTRIVKETERDLPAHIMFTVKIDVANPIHDYLQPFGLACVQLPKKEAEQCLADSFDYVCEVTGLEDNPWTLWRLKRTGSASLQKRNSVIFSPRNFPLMKGLNVPLELEKIQKFVARHDLERLEAVVIDNPAKSIITAWPGRDLIPWLQHLIKHAESLLWVTLHTSSSPSVDVAGTLLRTLQAEQPSLKVCWLVVDDAQTVNTSILQEIEAARMSMQQGDNEIRLQSDGKETKITRYLPDHDLSLATGVSVPYQVRDPVYHPPTNLAAANGAYIIIGGLGGLGRFVCSWLIEQGATSLYAISRSGISSPEARRLHDTLILTPRVQFQAIQADACDREAMTSVFKYIRGKEAIKGVINMAMVLGDAPLASMTGEQWDRALRVKIDSSWLLHELTSAADDGLEHFLLFSSIASVLGNRGQGGYNVGNAFLNALAVWRRKQGRVGVSVALGAMTDIGVLAELPDWDPEMTKKNLARSGLERLTAPHLAKILEAAFRKAGRQREGKESVPEDALIVTGLEMFEKEADGSLVGKGRSRGERLFWTELPEFSHLSAYRPPPSRGAADKDVPLKERVGRVVAKGDGQALKMMVEEGILGFLSTSLGFGRAAIDPGRSMGTYGLDSLNAVNCQFWCFRELGVDVSIAEIFEAKSIESFAGMVSGRIEARMGMVGGVGEGS
ncbi:MAG: hypothetical protein L6R39_007772 [Caloplaca ligustica]|nr:MAG: hypothetical protein L6R39_007772 [Caloplaca ligustica]